MGMWVCGAMGRRDRYCGIPFVDSAIRCLGGWLVEWGLYALSASKAIFRARTYNCNLFSPVMMIT